MKIFTVEKEPQALVQIDDSASNHKNLQNSLDIGI
jgi:hypothetical protein